MTFALYQVTSHAAGFVAVVNVYVDQAALCVALYLKYPSPCLGVSVAFMASNT